MWFDYGLKAKLSIYQLRVYDKSNEERDINNLIISEYQAYQVSKDCNEYLQRVKILSFHLQFHNFSSKTYPSWII